MNCERCKETIDSDQDVFDYYGSNLCEDCYISALQPPRACDPAAVESARATRSLMGQTGIEGLTPMQKRIFELIKERGKIPREELMTCFELPPWEFEKQLAILRHCELIRATKIGQTVYMTTM